MAVDPLPQNPIGRFDFRSPQRFGHLAGASAFSPAENKTFRISHSDTTTAATASTWHCVRPRRTAIFTRILGGALSDLLPWQCCGDCEPPFPAGRRRRSEPPLHEKLNRRYSLGGDDSFGSYHPRGVWRWRGRARAFASHVRLRVWTIGKLRLRAPPARARKSLYATVNCDAPCPKCLGLEWLQLGGILALIFYWEWRNFNCKLQISIDTRGCGSVPSLIRPSRTLSH